MNISSLMLHDQYEGNDCLDDDEQEQIRSKEISKITDKTTHRTQKLRGKFKIEKDHGVARKSIIIERL